MVQGTAPEKSTLRFVHNAKMKGNNINVSEASKYFISSNRSAHIHSVREPALGGHTSRACRGDAHVHL